MKLAFLFVFLFAHITLADQGKKVFLSFDRVAREKQEVLDWHIRWRFDRTFKDWTQYKVIDLCAVKNESADRQSDTLEIYNLPCPHSGLTEQDFLAKAQNLQPLNSFRLSPPLASTALDDLHQLKQKYNSTIADQIPSKTWEDLTLRSRNDSLGQLIFMPFKNKEMNIGYLSDENILMYLCSGAWGNLCIFDYRNKGKETDDFSRPDFVGNAQSITYMPYGFKPGFEEINYDDYPAETIDFWHFKKNRYEFLDVLSANLFSRGNDDSRPLAIYYFHSPVTKSKIPITEEWFRFFLNFPETKVRVGRMVDDKGQPLVSNRPRSEWNYVTALHPVHIVRMRNQETNKVATKVLMGASVIYNSALGLEEEDCDISETDGYYFRPAPNVSQSESESSYFSAFQENLLTMLPTYDPESDATRFSRVSQSQYRDKRGQELLYELQETQRQLVPTLESNGRLTFYGMDSELAIAPDQREQSWSILRFDEDTDGVYSQLLEDGFDALGNKLRSIYRLNYLKEFLVLKPIDDQNIEVELYGFNPNEFLSNNGGEVSISGLTTNFDTEAIYKVWSGQSHTYGLTHAAGRALAKDLTELSVRLAGKYYQASEPVGYNLRGDVLEIAQAYREGREVSPEHRDTFLARIDRKYRMTNLNLGGSLGEPGRVHFINNIAGFVRQSTNPEMAKASSWKFPSTLIYGHYKGETEEIKLVDFPLTSQITLREYIKLGKYSLPEILTLQNQVIVQQMMESPSAMEFILRAMDAERFVSDEVQKTSFRGYFQVFNLSQSISYEVSGLDPDRLKNLKVKAKEKLSPVDRDKFERFLANKNEIDGEINQCFLAADKKPQDMLSCNQEWVDFFGNVQQLLWN